MHAWRNLPIFCSASDTGACGINFENSTALIHGGEMRHPNALVSLQLERPCRLRLRQKGSMSMAEPQIERAGSPRPKEGKSMKLSELVANIRKATQPYHMRQLHV